MIKQRKLKHMKNIDKRFHKVSPQKKKKERKKEKRKEKFKLFLLTSIRDINRKLLEPFLLKSSALIEAFVPRYS